MQNKTTTIKFLLRRKELKEFSNLSPNLFHLPGISPDISFRKILVITAMILTINFSFVFPFIVFYYHKDCFGKKKSQMKEFNLCLKNLICILKSTKSINIQLKNFPKSLK